MVMDLSSVYGVLDGSQYKVDNVSSVSGTQNLMFDEVFNSTIEENLENIFQEVSAEYGVNVNLLKAVAQAESGMDPNATSWCGAMGIMQLMPTTAESYGVTDPYDARQSITGGAKLLSWLLDDYNGNVSLALAGYNAGCGSVQKYGGVPPFDETVNYIHKINDLLGGALSNDSWSIDGSTGTNLSNTDMGVASYHSNTLKQVEGMESKSADLPDGNKYLVKRTLGSNTNLTANADNNLFSIEDYAYFKDTIVDILKKRESSDEDTKEYKEAILKGRDAAKLLESSTQRSNTYNLYEAQASVAGSLRARIKK